nr:hypothetical protein [Acinetobacter sp. Marseille-Q1620]
MAIDQEVSFHPLCGDQITNAGETMKKTGSLKAYLSQLSQGYVGIRVGVLDSSTYPDGTPVAQVAAIQEYGAEVDVPEHSTTVYRSVNERTGDFNRNGRFVRKDQSNFATTHVVPAHKIVIPPRPFFRKTIAEYHCGWIKSIGQLIQQNGDVKKSMLLLGEQVKGDLTETILTFTDPPNAPATIARKGFNAPLRETSRLSRSISVELVDD